MHRCSCRPATAHRIAPVDSVTQPTHKKCHSKNTPKNISSRFPHQCCLFGSNTKARFDEIESHRRRELSALPPPQAGEGWGGGTAIASFRCLPPPCPSSRSRMFPTSADLIERPNSGKPEFGCKRGRGRCGTLCRSSHRQPPPPFTYTVSAVMNGQASEHMKSTSSPISSGSPKRFIGMSARNC